MITYGTLLDFRTVYKPEIWSDFYIIWTLIESKAKTKAEVSLLIEKCFTNNFFVSKQMKLFVVLLIVAIVALDVGLVIPAQAQDLPIRSCNDMPCPDDYACTRTTRICIPSCVKDPNDCKRRLGSSFACDTYTGLCVPEQLIDYI